MAWGNEGINHYQYGAGTWSKYYWNDSYNPGATFQLCLANCTTLVYGRVIENGLPRPVTEFRNAENWRYYVNTDDGWVLMSYSSGMSLQPSDIIGWIGGHHVAVVETYGTNPNVSGSYYTDDTGHSSGNRSTSVMGNTLADVSNWMVSHYATRFYHYWALSTENSWVGDTPDFVIRYSGIIPPTPTETPTVTVTPSSYTVTMLSSQDYVDFPYNVVVTGIPDGYSASGSNTFPNLTRVANTGWSYVDYVVDGITYRRATKQQTLRYQRNSNNAYTTTEYMYYNFSYPNGTASSTTPMHITVYAKSIAGIIKGIRKRKKRYIMQLK